VKPEDVLSKYSLTRETAAQYIDAATRLNASETAGELDVSRDTIHRYKRAFAEMSAQERLLLISALAQNQLLDKVTTED